MVAVSETRIDPLDMLDSLSMLVERSLIGFDEVTGRYSMLETVRQYSREKLADSDEGRRVRDKHAEHVRGFLKSLPAPEKIDDSTKMIALVNGDIDNVRAAFEHLITSERFGEADGYWVRSTCIGVGQGSWRKCAPTIGDCWSRFERTNPRLMKG